MPRTLQHIEDELLVIRCQDGEADALEELIVRWRVRLHAHAWSLTGDAEADLPFRWRQVPRLVYLPHRIK